MDTSHYASPRELVSVFGVPCRRVSRYIIDDIGIIRVSFLVLYVMLLTERWRVEGVCDFSDE